MTLLPSICNFEPLRCGSTIHDKEDSSHLDVVSLSGEDPQERIVVPGLVSFLDFQCVTGLQDDNLGKVDFFPVADLEFCLVVQELVTHHFVGQRYPVVQMLDTLHHDVVVEPLLRILQSLVVSWRKESCSTTSEQLLFGSMCDTGFIQEERGHVHVSW